MVIVRPGPSHLRCSQRNRGCGVRRMKSTTVARMLRGDPSSLMLNGASRVDQSLIRTAAAGGLLCREPRDRTRIRAFAALAAKSAGEYKKLAGRPA